MTTNITCSNNRTACPNVDDHHKDAFLMPILMTIFCTVGAFGNILSVIIFTRKSMRSSINELLAALSLADFFVVTLSLLVFCLPVLVNNYVFSATEIFHAYSYMVVIVYPLLMTSQTASLWVVVLINIERYTAVCRPFMVAKWFTVEKTRVILLALILGSVVYNLIRFFEFGIDENHLVKDVLRTNIFYYHIYYTSLYLVTHFLTPFLIVITLNIFVLREISRAKKVRQIMTKKRTNQQKTTQLIVVVTIIFGLCNTLPFVLNVWEAVDSDVFWGQKTATALLVTDLANLLVILNSASTFLVYLFYCEKYRRTLINWLLCRSESKKLSFSVEVSRRDTPSSRCRSSTNARHACSTKSSIENSSRKTSTAHSKYLSTPQLERRGIIVADSRVLLRLTSDDPSFYTCNL
uniref:G-protein coupled receptors family 1 profile domain-containing protein n=1 Tax=Romanomermis culicivorax TaxID=13658 RepID=A0A915HPV5_ROMCU